MRRFLLGLAITLACVALLLRLIPWTSTRAALEAANPGFIVLAISCLVISLIASSEALHCACRSVSTAASAALSTRTLPTEKPGVRGVVV